MKTRVLKVLFSSLVLCCMHLDCDGKVVYVRFEENTGVLSIQEERTEDWIAMGNFTAAQFNSTGWSFLEVYTNGVYSDKVQAYGAGLVEGFSTQEMTAMHIHNSLNGYCKTPLSAYCQRLQQFLKTNFAWMESKIQSLAAKDSYWHQVELFLIQMNGLKDGYSGSPKTVRYSVDDVLNDIVLMQIGGDLEDLEAALHKENQQRILGSGSCSGLIKLLPGNEDLYVSQDTWNGYNNMLRILKKYDFQFHTTQDSGNLIPGPVATFSSYPGSLTSGDDFYIISSGLVTQETTIGNGNADLWKYVKPEGSVFEGIRSVVANRLATGGKQWTDIFSAHNSGTYNNQWMIVDYNKFKAGQPLVDKDLLYVLEQIPGKIVSDDLTHVLAKQKYWPSYNTAYFPEIFNASGQPDMVKKYGDWFTYDHTPRANIFRRDHVKVKDLNSMLKLMRYNDYTHDPLSRCNCTPPYSGENAISARSDLNPASGKYPFGALGHRAHGGTDSKITTSKMAQSLQFLSVAGPTYDQVPAFQWSKSDFRNDLPHLGHPDLFKFQPIIHQWQRRYHVSNMADQ